VAKAPVAVSILDPKRVNNIEIMLRGLKLNHIEIKLALVNMDDNPDTGLSVEKLRAIQSNLPTPDELALIDGYEGDKSELGNAEKYFMAISKISLLELRVNSLEYKSGFEARSKDLIHSVEVLISALKITKSDKRFHQLLEVILAIGNYLNGSTKLGQTHGFKLQSLAKLADVKSMKTPTFTLLNFLADFLPKEYPDLFQSFREFTSIHESARENTTDVIKQITDLVTGFNKIKQQLESQSCDASYLRAMKDWSQNTAQIIEDLSSRKDIIFTEFKEVLVMFSEPNTTKSEDFFGLLSSFITSIEQAYAINKKKKAEEEKLKGKGGDYAYDRILKNMKTGEALMESLKERTKLIQKSE